MMTKESDKPGLKVERNDKTDEKNKTKSSPTAASSTKKNEDVLVASQPESSPPQSPPPPPSSSTESEPPSSDLPSESESSKKLKSEISLKPEKSDKDKEEESVSVIEVELETGTPTKSASEIEKNKKNITRVVPSSLLQSENKENKRSVSIGSVGSPMGLPSEQLLVSSPKNGHDSASLKNGFKRNNSGRQKCRCWCCCCTCSCLAPKNGETKSNKEAESDLICDPDPPPTLEEIRSWGDSFDRLMRSSGGRKVFRDFLKCEYSEENILFWLACEELKKERVPEVIEEKARLIYEDYISILSPKEVSLDSRVRDIVNQNMRNPRLSTFDEAQLQIYTLMHRDSYPRFVNSPLFKKLAQLNMVTPTGTGPGSHRGSIVSATSPPSRKQSTAAS